MKRVTVGVLAYDFLPRFLSKLDEVVRPTLQYWLTQHHHKAELLLLDNSPYGLTRVEHASVRWTNTLSALADVTYLWNCGRNEQYSASLNRMARLAHNHILVFLCLNHCRLYDPSWIDDVVAAFDDSAGDSAVVLAGTLALTDYRYCPTLGTGLSQHVQGGLFGVDADWLRHYPYDAVHWSQKYSDIYISTRALNAGYKLAEVPSLRSVWAAEVPEPPPLGIKVVHDHNHT